MRNKELIIIMAEFEALKTSLKTKGITPPEEVFLTSDQMERLLKCSPATLYRLRNKGVVPCTKIGGQYRYPKHFFTQEVIKSITKIEDSSKRFDD